MYSTKKKGSDILTVACFAESAVQVFKLKSDSICDAILYVCRFPLDLTKRLPVTLVSN